MKKYLPLLFILLSFAACIPPGKLNESLVNANKLSKSLDLLKTGHADSVVLYKAKEKVFLQRIGQLEDSISLVVKACAETQRQPDTAASLGTRPQYVIYFDFDKYNLIDSSFKVLSEVVDFLKRNEDYSCVLQGYTDLEGPPEYNLKLSEKRVLSARGYLLSYSISSNRVTGSFFGKSFANVELKDRKANWRNRRVEIFLTQNLTQNETQR